MTRWTVVVPYYNEAGFLPETLASLAAQTVRPLRIVLVDNASTDGSAALCGAFAAANLDLEVINVFEARPGQVHALERGIAEVDTPFTAICDADTYYPPQYLARAGVLFADGGAETVAVMALSVSGDSESLGSRLRRRKGMLASRLLRRQNHAGGYAMCFRTAALRAAGGYSRAAWPYVLKDQELAHRVGKLGRCRYDYRHWCRTSDRRADRSNVRWTLAERLLYHLTPYRFKDWFFYDFLARRLEARRLDDLNLRTRTWNGSG
jgi:glycosyltransferase involved in cell wall biosynthesis